MPTARTTTSAINLRRSRKIRKYERMVTPGILPAMADCGTDDVRLVVSAHMLSGRHVLAHSNEAGGKRRRSGGGGVLIERTGRCAAYPVSTPSGHRRRRET